MLNISNSSIADKVKRQEYSSLMLVESKLSKKVLRRIIFISFGLVVLVMFLPWTQNVRSNGTITTLEIDQRPQNVHSVIGGRIESWFVTEGDFAEAGDTIVQISEIKDDYLDPDLVVRTQNQLGFKEQSVTVYGGKVRAKGLQIEALSERRVLEKEQAIIKIKQSVLKVQSDSVAYLASRLNYSTAQAQYLRADSLYAKGFKSLVELE